MDYEDIGAVVMVSILLAFAVAILAALGGLAWMF
jgi:hypothetical protein